MNRAILTGKKSNAPRTLTPVFVDVKPGDFSRPTVTYQTPVASNTVAA
jgi:hypothetical protein